jgi:hypothetical protein
MCPGSLTSAWEAVLCLERFSEWENAFKNTIFIEKINLLTCGNLFETSLRLDEARALDMKHRLTSNRKSLEDGLLQACVRLHMLTLIKRLRLVHHFDRNILAAPDVGFLKLRAT